MDHVDDTDSGSGTSQASTPLTLVPADGPGSDDEFEPYDTSPASMSITSSVYAHTFEGGRRYHSYKHGRYPVPNDDIEQAREDMKHAMVMELTNGTLFYAPVGPCPQKILDVGTGTGIWAVSGSSATARHPIRCSRPPADRNNPHNSRLPVPQRRGPRHRPLAHPAHLGAAQRPLPRRRRRGRVDGQGLRSGALPLRRRRPHRRQEGAWIRLQVSPAGAGTVPFPEQRRLTTPPGA